MSVRYRYSTVSVLYRILRVGIGIIPYRTDTENTKKWIPIGIPIGIGIGTGSVRYRYGIGIRWHMLIPNHKHSLYVLFFITLFIVLDFYIINKFSLLFVKKFFITN
ncbi:hypothetical protein Hanom_Chr09g00832091 [Helianthus anomalus]